MSPAPPPPPDNPRRKPRPDARRKPSRRPAARPADRPRDASAQAEDAGEATDAAEALVLQLWALAEAGRPLDGERVAAAFREGKVSPRMKARVMPDLHAMLRRARRVDHLLDAAGVRQGPQRARAQWFATRWLNGACDEAALRAALPSIDWAKARAADAAITDLDDPVRRLALTFSYSDALAGALHAAYGDEAFALAEGLDAPAPRTVRVNALKATREDVRAMLEDEGWHAAPAPWAAHALHLEGEGDLFATHAFQEGLIEVQDEASQLVAELTAASTGTLVVDLCAGAGGKTLALGAAMKNKGVLLAADRHAARLNECKRRARRAGLHCHRIVEADLADADWPPALAEAKGRAARVLVDAPCSGSGALRRNPEIRARIDAGMLERLPHEQYAIARAALDLCKPNGRLVYATCSVLPGENERVVERLLEDERFALVPLGEILGGARAKALGDASGKFLKLYPHRHGTDGFFAAVLRRTP